MTIFRKIFNGFEKVDSPTFQQVRFYINGNFNKAIKLLISIYGMRCVVCDYASPDFRKESGVADHYYSRHREDTIIFVRDNLMTKDSDELMEILSHV